MKTRCKRDERGCGDVSLDVNEERIGIRGIALWGCKSLFQCSVLVKRKKFFFFFFCFRLDRQSGDRQLGVTTTLAVPRKRKGSTKRAIYWSCSGLLWGVGWGYSCNWRVKEEEKKKKIIIIK